MTDVLLWCGTNEKDFETHKKHYEQHVPVGFELEARTERRTELSTEDGKIKFKPTQTKEGKEYIYTLKFIDKRPKTRKK